MNDPFNETGLLETYCFHIPYISVCYVSVSRNSINFRCSWEKIYRRFKKVVKAEQRKNSNIERFVFLFFFKLFLCLEFGLKHFKTVLCCLTQFQGIREMYLQVELCQETKIVIKFVELYTFLVLGLYMFYFQTIYGTLSSKNAQSINFAAVTAYRIY